mmetsp:Transcript_19474/g.61810  ORF Transcript_19474/g.61810 Transcript_19474/m.61810 type:complete len:209 (-) Transcript_19474:710-1336(-)
MEQEGQHGALGPVGSPNCITINADIQRCDAWWQRGPIRFRAPAEGPGDHHRWPFLVVAFTTWRGAGGRRGHCLHGPMHLAVVEVLDDEELHIVLPIVGRLQGREHAVGDLEGRGRSEEFLRVVLARARKLLQKAQCVASVLRWEDVLDRVEEGQAHLHQDAPACNEEPVPDAPNRCLLEIAGKEGQEPLDGVVLRVHAVPDKCSVHLG